MSGGDNGGAAADFAPSGWSVRAYLRFLAAVAATVILLGGIAVALSTAAEAGVLRAISAALGATGLASALSGIPLARFGGPPYAAVNRSLVAMLLRLALVAVLAAVCLLNFDLPQRPFLLWLVIGYLALLAVDTLFAVRSFRSL